MRRSTSKNQVTTQKKIAAKEVEMGLTENPPESYFTPFSIVVKQMQKQDGSDEEIGNQTSEFRKFRIVVKEYFEDEPTSFDSFKIIIPQLKESMIEPQSNSMSIRNEFIEFTKIRYKNSNSQIVDLKVCDLREIVFFLYKEKLMEDCIFRKFQLNYKEKEELKFIELHNMHEYMEKNDKKKNKTENSSIVFDLEEKNFLKKTLFALIDYRIFSQILLTKYPSKYQMTELPRSFVFQTNQYLEAIYQMSPNQYLQYFDEFNHRFKRFWMPKGADLLENQTYFKHILDERCSKALRNIFNFDRSQDTPQQIQ